MKKAWKQKDVKITYVDLDDALQGLMSGYVNFILKYPEAIYSHFIEEKLIQFIMPLRIIGEIYKKKGDCVSRDERQILKQVYDFVRFFENFLGDWALRADAQMTAATNEVKTKIARDATGHYVERDIIKKLMNEAKEKSKHDELSYAEISRRIFDKFEKSRKDAIANGQIEISRKMKDTSGKMASDRSQGIKALAKRIERISKDDLDKRADGEALVVERAVAELLSRKAASRVPEKSRRSKPSSPNRSSRAPRLATEAAPGRR